MIAWQIIANTAADTLARTNPEAALNWRPDSSLALIGLVTEQLSAAEPNDSNLAGIASLAGRAIIADPLDPDALRLLGLAADLNGDASKAEALMRIAAARSRRDSGAQLWLLDHRLRIRDVAGAFENADAILRTYPNLEQTVVPPLLAVSAEPAAKQIVVDSLATDPPWRASFLSRLSQDPAASSSVYGLLTSLRATAHPPRASELNTYLQAVIAQGDYQSAFLAWVSFLPPEESLSVPLAYNGDFELPISGLPFDWVFLPVNGATTEVVYAPRTKGGKALRVVFSGARVAYRHATKLMLLEPGTYQLTGRAMAESLMTSRGMRWRVACASGQSQLGETESFEGTFDWRAFAVTFTVPAECPAQTLRLELDARVALDQQVSGTFWSDDLRVSRSDTLGSQ